MSNPVHEERKSNVVDTRNLLDTERWKEAGFNVHEMGVGH
jgi:hypothetical protein